MNIVLEQSTLLKFSFSFESVTVFYCTLVSIPVLDIFYASRQQQNRCSIALNSFQRIHLFCNHTSSFYFALHSRLPVLQLCTPRLYLHTGLSKVKRLSHSDIRHWKSLSKEIMSFLFPFLASSVSSLGQPTSRLPFIVVNRI